MKTTMQQLKEWLPLIVPIIGIFVIAIETRFQVQQLVQDKQAQRKQWEVISANRGRLDKMESWKIEKIDPVITPRGIQQWGAVKEQVPRNTINIEDLQQRVLRLELGVSERTSP